MFEYAIVWKILSVLQVKKKKKRGKGNENMWRKIKKKKKLLNIKLPKYLCYKQYI